MKISTKAVGLLVVCGFISVAAGIWHYMATGDVSGALAEAVVGTVALTAIAGVVLDAAGFRILRQPRA